MTIYQIIAALLGLMTTWALFWLRNQREDMQTLEKQINALETKCAVLKNETENIQRVLGAFSDKLDDLNEKLTEVLGMRPLLQNVIESVKELRPRP